MSTSSLVAPQLVLASRTLYTNWIPADPDACAALLPPPFQPAANHAVYMNQYVVDRAEQTTGLGAYSLTHLGLDLSTHGAPGGAKPGRFVTHHINSSAGVRSFVIERGVPATPGTTELAFEGDVLTATTYADGKPIIRTRARVADVDDVSAYSGHVRYITRVGDRYVSSMYPYIAEITNDFELISLEFLDPSHPVYALRPENPPAILDYDCFYAPRNSFVFPGGEEDLGPA